MTVLRTSNAPIRLDKGKPVSTETDLVGWQAPSDWLTFTLPTASDQEVIGTVAVYNQESNYFALQATITDATQYTVDWGDGTSTNHNSGTLAEKNYVYGDISSGTLTSEGYRQAIVTVTPTTAGKTFSALQLSRRHTALSTNVNQTNPWLNIAIAAPNATAIDFAFSNTNSGTDRIPCTFLEQVQIISSNIAIAASVFRSLPALQSVVFNTSATLTSTANMFNGCRQLKIVPFLNTTSVTTMQSMFQGCTALETVPLYNSASVTNMTSMFNDCVSLRSVPLFNTSNVTSISSMFTSCESLNTVPLFDTSSATSFSGLFSGCTALETVPLFNTSNVTNMSSMFASCESLKTVPLFDTSNVTTMNNMFFFNFGLLSVPLFNTSNVTIMSGMFQNCSNLKSSPLFDTDQVTNMATMLSQTTSLREIPELNMSSISSLANSNINLGSATVNNAASSLGRAKITGNKWTQSFQNCRMGAAQLDEMYTALATLNPAITNASGSGTVVTYTVGVGNTSPFVVGRTVAVTAVDPVAYNITGTVASVDAGAGTFTITNAATGAYVSGGIAAVTSDRTITVTGNPGVATDDPTIATNKGWTVTG